jgi:signal transduction histidine kinase
MIKLNIQWKTTIIFLLVIVSLIIVFNFFLLPGIEKSIEEKTIENVENIVGFYGSEIENYLLTNANTIEILARNPVFYKENISKNEILDQLNTTKYFYTAYEDISYLDTRGNVILSTDYQYRGDWTENKWYKESLHGNSTISDAYIILRPWKLVIQFFSPVKDNNASIIGTLAGQINFHEFWQLLNSVQIEDTGRFILINEQGNILSDIDQSNIFQQSDIYKKGLISDTLVYNTGEYYSDKNVTTLYSYIQVGHNFIMDSYWTLVYVQDYDEILAGISSFRNKAFLLFSIVLCIIIFIGYYISSSIIKPLKLLQDGMKTIAKGNLQHRIYFNRKDELGLLANSFNKMAADLDKTQKTADRRQEQIKELLVQKDNFINQLGHDLKNPLGPLLNLIPIIAQKQNDSSINEMLDVVLRNTHYMKNLVTKTIELAQLKSPNIALHIERINLYDEISDIITTNKLLLQNSDIKVINQVSSDVEIEFDRIRFQQLINNLISNSVKYSSHSTVITIQNKIDNDHIILSLQDQGIGMTEKQLNHIFDEFYKADMSRHDFESSGLGMSICKQIIEKHGGTIWVDSPGKDKGSTFFISLPMILEKQDSFDVHDEIDKLIGFP